jgi:hypothetical protein
MGVYGGPHIPQSVNICLTLDASSLRSYPGTGTVWNDVSNSNIPFSSYGTQTPFATLNGVKCMDFNGSGYWQSTGGTSKSDLCDLAGDMTLIMWVYAENNTERDTIFEKAGTSYQSYEQEIAVTLETNESLSWYSRKSSYGYASTAAMTQGSWNMMGIKMSTGKTTTRRTGFRSKNGSSWASAWTSRSTNAILTAGAVRVGTGYAGPVENGYINSVYCWTTMLSDAEVLAMYNNTKGKFGL